MKTANKKRRLMPRLGAEAFVALVHRGGAGGHKDRRRKSRAQEKAALRQEAE